MASGDVGAMHVAELIRKLVYSSPKPSQPIPLSDGSISHGRILTAAVLLLLVAYGVSKYLSSGGHIRPERVSLVPISLLQPSPVSTASPTTSRSMLLARAHHFDNGNWMPKSDGTVLWPHTIGPGPYGL